MMLSFFVGPLHAGAVEHLSVVLQESRCQCSYVFAQLLCRYPLLAESQHGLLHGYYYRCTQLAVHIQLRSNIGMMPRFFNSS